jgi:hypothetical protein
VRLDGENPAIPLHGIVGELEYDGLPGALRAPLDDQGLLGPNYFVVRHGRNPQEEVSFLIGLTVIGAVVFLGGVGWKLKHRHTVAG